MDLVMSISDHVIVLDYGIKIAEGKPADMVEKIVDGQLKKYFAERCLLEQPYIKNPDITVGEHVKQNAALMNENVVVRRFSRIALGEVA